MYDLIVIGAGIEGMAASIQAVKNNLKVLVVAKTVAEHNQEENLLDVFNTKPLVDKFNNLVKEHSLELMNRTEVISLEKNIVSFSVEIKSGTVYYAKSVIIAAGGGASVFDHITQKTSSEKIKITESVKTSIAGIYAVGEAAGTENFSLLSRIGDASRAAELASDKK